MPTTEEQDKLKERTWISEFAGLCMLRHAGKNSFGRFGQLAMPLSVRFASDTPDFCSQCQCHRDEPLYRWHPKWSEERFCQLELFTSLVFAAGRGLNRLFHGTLVPKQILDEDRLLHSFWGSRKVAFTRSPAVAVHFATLERDFSERFGAVLVFDKGLLQTRYRVLPFAEDGHPASSPGRGEFEECVMFRDVENISRYLITVVWHPCARQQSGFARAASAVRGRPRREARGREFD